MKVYVVTDISTDEEVSESTRPVAVYTSLKKATQYLEEVAIMLGLDEYTTSEYVPWRRSFTGGGVRLDLWEEEIVE